MDWKDVLTLFHGNMTDDEKEKLFDKISWLDADDIEITFGDLKGLFGIAQEMLRFKGEQVRTLSSELEDLTTRHRHLEAELASCLKANNGKGSSSSRRFSEKVSKQEEEIQHNNQIMEQLMSEIADLEERKESLLQERHSDERESVSSRDPITELETVRHLSESVKTKNKHIKQLLGDLQTVEKENNVLKTKLAHLREKLGEATYDITDLTNKVTKLRHEKTSFKEKIQSFEEMKSSFDIQMEEMKLLNTEKDKYLDEYNQEMEKRVSELKQALKKKDLEANILHEEVLKLESMLPTDDTEETILSGMVKQRDSQIRELQIKLSEATREIESSVNLIERLYKEKDDKTNMTDSFRSAMQLRKLSPSDDSADSPSATDLRAQIRQLEYYIERKEQELVESLRELQIYKSGEDGIKALMKEVSRLKDSLRSKDDSIKSLVQENNALNARTETFQMENEVMRRKLKLPMNKELPTNSISLKISKLEKHSIAADKKVADMESANLALQMEIRSKNRKMQRMEHYLKNFDVTGLMEVQNSTDSDSSMAALSSQNEGKLTNRSTKALKESLIEKPSSKTVAIKDETEIMMHNFRLLVDENEGLRKGLHEVLDAIKAIGLSTSCNIRSSSLEHIVLALDARHMSGWYNPEMSTQMELQAAIGGRDALQTALADARKEIKTAIELLSKEMTKSSELEQKLMNLQERGEAYSPSQQIHQSAVDGESFGAWVVDDIRLEDVDFSNRESIKETYMKPLNKKHVLLLQENLSYFQRQFALLYEKIVTISHQSAKDKHGWSLREEQYKMQVANLLAKIDSANSNDSESENSIGCISKPKRRINEVEYLDRKCQYLAECFKRFRMDNERLKMDLLTVEKALRESEGGYENRILTMILTLNGLYDRLRNSVPLSVFLKQNQLLNDTNLKYRESLEKQMLCVSDRPEARGQELDLMHSEVNHLKMERDDLLICLASEREKNIHIYLSNDDKYAALAKELASLKSKNQLLTHEGRRKDSSFLIVKTQVESLSRKMEDLHSVIDEMHSKNIEQQNVQRDLIDKMASCVTFEEHEQVTKKIDSLTEENGELKLKVASLTARLDSTQNELKDVLQSKFAIDLEMNMLQHQVLDLQATDDNKAIVGRLGSEIMLSHLQTSELHRKLDKLSSQLERERLKRAQTESILAEKDRKFEVYASRFEFRNRFLSEVIQTLRKQYEGGFPLVLMENHLHDKSRLKKMELRLNSALDLPLKQDSNDDMASENADANASCQAEEDGCACQHFMQLKLNESKYYRETDVLKKKLRAVEVSREELLQKYNTLEETFMMISYAFEKKASLGKEHVSTPIPTSNLEVYDMDAHIQDPLEDSPIIIPIPKPRKITATPQPSRQSSARMNRDTETVLPGSPTSARQKSPVPLKTVIIQTDPEDVTPKTSIQLQTEPVQDDHLQDTIDELKDTLDSKTSELEKALHLVKERSEKILNLETEVSSLSTRYNYAMQLVNEKESTIRDLNAQIEGLNEEKRKDRSATSAEPRENEIESAEIQLDAMRRERDDSKTLHERAQRKLQEMQDKIIELEKESNCLRSALVNPATLDTVNETVEKYATKVLELESKSFRLQTEVDNHLSELLSATTETERWKNLAIERFSKIEMLGKQLEDRHSSEMESYRMEATHWMAELTNSQRETVILKTQISEQKASFVKQVVEKESIICRLREMNDNLKMQILKMQSILSNAAPALDLSSILEMEEEEEEREEPTSDRLQLRLQHANDLGEYRNESDENLISSSREGTTLVSPGWHDSLVNRLRREKQLISKQNMVLRRQLKILAGRERRSKLEAQNLKSQMKRSSTSGKGIPYSNSEDTNMSTLRSKITNLQEQLAAMQSESDRSKMNINSMALWEKQKRWQMIAERFKTRFEEKSIEYDKLKMSYEGIRSAVSRLEKEKRMLEARLAKISKDRGNEPAHPSGEEKQLLDTLLRENDSLRGQLTTLKDSIKSSSHIERIEQQQRRIVALELAGKGDHHLIHEYERILAQNALLTRQNLKLESSILEQQIQSAVDGASGDAATAIASNRGDCCSRAEREIEHLKDYINTLKEENSQLSASRWNNSCTDVQSTIAGMPPTKRQADLERTVLTLRGLVSKLQAENRHLLTARKMDQSKSQFDL